MLVCRKGVSMIKSSKIDWKVVSVINTLNKNLPDILKIKSGSDYNISPPFGERKIL